MPRVSAAFLDKSIVCFDLGFIRSLTLTTTDLRFVKLVTRTVLPSGNVPWVAAVKAFLSYFSPFIATFRPFMLSL
jgi:hypothetical protein